MRLCLDSHPRISVLSLPSVVRIYN